VFNFRKIILKSITKFTKTDLNNYKQLDLPTLFEHFKLKILQAVSDAMLVELKQCFMEAYDDNQDGKIDIREVMRCIIF